MALKINFSDHIPTEDRENTAITDITGDYNVSTNPDGYGSPNDLRTDYAYIAIAYDMNGDEPEELDLNTYDPESVSIFTLPLSIDGYYKLEIYIVPIEDYNISIPSNEDLINSDYECITKQIKFVENAQTKLEQLFKEITDKRRESGQEADVTELAKSRDFIHNQMISANYEFCDANYENVKLIISSINQYVNNNS